MSENVIIEYSGFAPLVKQIVVSSIEENFQQQGRYGNGVFGGGNTKWEQSLRAKKKGGMTLQNTGQLAASVRVEVNATGGLMLSSDGADIGMSANGSIDIVMGSNKSYAAIHQEGGEIDIASREGSAKWKATKNKETGNYRYRFAKSSSKTKNTIERKFKVGSYKILMPKRPFLVLQDEDLIKIQEKFLEWLIKRG